MSFYVPELDPNYPFLFTSEELDAYQPPPSAIEQITTAFQNTLDKAIAQAIAQSQSPAITSDRANYLSGNSASNTEYTPIYPAPVPVPSLSQRMTGRDAKEAAFISAFDAATVNHRTLEGFNTFLTDFVTILFKQWSPASRLPLIATGVYKECYEAYDGWIVKFAVEDNNSDTEQYVYEAACRTGFDVLFAETIYLTLPSPLPATQIKGNSDPLVKMILQRAADPVFVSTPAKGTLYQGHPLIDEWLGELQIGSVPWAEDVILAYGENCLEAFARFILEYYLCDMHAGNLGYINGLPVVFDWMSDPRDPLDTSPRV